MPGPIAVNTMAPDEGNMYLLGKIGSPEQRERFLKPLVEGRARSAFFMTEPWEEGAPVPTRSMLMTTARRDADHWVINGRKRFITGAVGATVGIVMAKSDAGACLFLVDLPSAGVVIASGVDACAADQMSLDDRDFHSRRARAPGQ
jgi:acyl-CoA dehydrogenase